MTMFLREALKASKRHRASSPDRIFDRVFVTEIADNDLIFRRFDSRSGKLLEVAAHQTLQDIDARMLVQMMWRPVDYAWIGAR